MISLFLDTHSKNLNIGLVKNDILDEIKLKDLGSHSNLFLYNVDNLLKKNNVNPSDIDKIIVINGPGSFTGIRIAVTCAKVYAYMLNKQITPISSLKSYALSIKDFDYVVSIIDARRGYVYASIYNKNMKEILKDSYISLDDLKEKIKNLDGTIKYIGNGNFEGIKIEEPDLDILKIVKYCENEESINPHIVNPNYLKKTEAEEKNDKKSQ